MKTFICKLLFVPIFLVGFAAIAQADALDNWTSCQVTNPPDVEGLYLLGVAYGNGRYVTVGQFAVDDNGAIETSDDGTNWVIRNALNYSILDLATVTYGNGMFVAAGWDYDSGNNLYNSTNGINWTSHTSKISNFYGSTYGGSLFVAVGDGILLQGTTGTNKNIYTSPDGITWTARASGAPVNDVDALSDVAFGNGTYVAVSYPYSASSYFHTSTSGTIWTRTPAGYQLSGNVSYCHGLFYAPAGSGTNLVSANGTTWTVLTNNTSSTFGRIIYTNGLYVTLSGASLFTSTDGTNWSQRNFHGPTNNVLSGVVFGPRNVITVGYENNVYTFPYSADIPTAFISDPLVALGINTGTSHQLKLSGVNGWSYGIQYSSVLNLASWQTVTNFTLSNSPSVWTDMNATNSSKFYRATLSVH